MSDGTTKEVLTPYTSRAKELGDLYQVHREIKDKRKHSWHTLY